MEVEVINAIWVAVGTSLATGLVSSVATTKALHVHIDYLRKNDERQEEAIARAHSRLDKVEKK